MVFRQIANVAASDQLTGTMPKYSRFSTGLPDNSQQNLNQRCLASSVRSQQPVNRTTRNFQTDSLKSVHATLSQHSNAIRLLKIPDVNNRFSRNQNTFFRSNCHRTRPVLAENTLAATSVFTFNPLSLPAIRKKHRNLCHGWPKRTEQQDCKEIRTQIRPKSHCSHSDQALRESRETTVVEA